MQGSARKDVVFGAARVYTVTVPGPKWKSWLQRYLDEFTFRFNRRKSRHVGKIFHRLVEQLVLRKALTYRDITAKHQHFLIEG